MRTRWTVGFTLIEVIMSLFILSIILLGFGGMLFQAERHTYTDYHFSVASHQIITIIERLHALRDAGGLEDQMNIWNTQNMLLLPKGVGVILGSYPSYTVTLYWGKKSINCEVNCIRKNITV